MAVANIAVARFGVAALPYTAFIMVGFDLVARDLLHEAWAGSLVVRMGALIVVGGLVTWALSPQAGRVAVASSASFAVCGLVNALVYHALIRRRRLVKMHASNAAAAVADSLVFPAVALGVLDPTVTATQAAAKWCGGVVWAGLYLRAIRGRGLK